MKKIALFFTICFLTNISVGFCAYFYADAVENAIQTSFSANVQEAVATEYEAQMNPNTGEIDTDGIFNVCYAGGFDVTTEEGAQNCANFVDLATNSCVYATGNSITYYTNPTTEEQKVRKCVFDATMDYVFSYEKGFQRSPNDMGNRICDKFGHPLKDAEGNYLLGATNLGITTCSSGLSVECIRKLTEKDARNYYWTRFYWKYGYHRLPIETLAAVMELAVGGTGTVAAELRQVANITNCGKSAVVDDCVADAVKKYVNEHGVNKFYENITTLRANKRTAKAKERALGVRNLSDLHIKCSRK